jgi:ABC-2 type transport system permease protein
VTATLAPVRAQTKAELKLLVRNGEQVLLTLGIPVVLLVFFSLVDVLPTDTADPVDFLAPGVLALAIMSTAMVGLGIATGFERMYGVLKRLGSTPLSRAGLLSAKTITMIVVEAVQLAVLIPIAYALGWRPHGGGWLAALAAIVVGTIAFAGIGLAIAGRLPGLVNLAAQNGIYLVLLLLGGMVVPLGKLPGPLRTGARLLPSTALSEALRGALGPAGSVPTRSWIVLAVWAVVAPAAAARFFRWE